MIRRNGFYKNTVLRLAPVILALSMAASPCAVLAAEEPQQEQTQEAPAEGQEAAAEESASEGSTEGAPESATAEEPAADLPTDSTQTTSSMSEELSHQRSQIADDDIFQVRIGYSFGKNDFAEWERGTAFVVGSRYLLTRQSLVNTTTESYLYKKILLRDDDSYKRVGVDLRDKVETEKHITFYVEDRSGNSYEYTDVAIKNGMGLIILKDPLDSVPAVVFADPSRIDYAAGQLIHLKAAGKMDGRCDVKTVEGTLVENTDANAAFSFRADDAEASVLGAPLYNEEGNVTGMVAGVGDIKTGFDVNAMRTFLSINGVKYRSEEKIRAEMESLEQEAEEAERAENEGEKEEVLVNTAALENAISSARSISDLSGYTKESAEAFVSALGEAESVLASEDATQEDIDAAAKKLETAQGALVKKNFIQKYGIYVLAAGIIAMFVAIICAAIKLLLPKKEDDDEDAVEKPAGKEKKGLLPAFGKDKKKKETSDKASKADKDTSDDDPGQDDFGFPEDPDDYSSPHGHKYIPDEEEGIDITHRTAGSSRRARAEDIPEDMEYLDRDNDPDGKVTVLNDSGSAATTLLNENTAYLVREDNGSKIRITPQEWEVRMGTQRVRKTCFIIGKEQKNVSYCTGPQNSTISRTHCMLELINGKYYITDLESKNHTFINGNQIPAYTAILLTDKMEIRLSNLKFTFHEA